jgi:uroporphyrinogen III methyltransferase/synthase
MRVASIGPITSQTAHDNGLKVDVEAKRHDVDGLVEAIGAFFAGKPAEKSQKR